MCATALIELMMLAMLLHVLHYSGFTKRQKTWFILTFTGVMICAAAEYAVHCGFYDPAFRVPLTVLTVIQFSLSPLLLVFFSGALGLHDEARDALKFFLMNVLVEAACAPFGMVFYFDENGYSRGVFFFIYISCYFIGFVYLIASMTVVGRRFRHRDSVTIIMVVVMLAAGILPMTIFKINIAYISIGLCASLCYVYYNDLVQEDVQADLIASREKMAEMQNHTVSGLANLIESRDTETGGHVSRTCALVREIAEKARKEGVYADEIDDRFISLIYSLAPMHDVGKIVVPDSILRKPGKLTPEEFEQMKKHANKGGEVVRSILEGVADEEYVSFASDIATYHHERWDGAGYPEGISGEKIPLCARIMAIADVYDALVSKRCYKDPIPHSDAVKVIESEAGTHFDPKLVEVFLSLTKNAENAENA